MSEYNIDVTVEHNPDDHPLIDVTVSDDPVSSITVDVTETPGVFPQISIDVEEGLDVWPTITVDVSADLLTYPEVLVTVSDYTGTIHQHDADYYPRGEADLLFYPRVAADATFSPLGHSHSTLIDLILTNATATSSSGGGALQIGTYDSTQTLAFDREGIQAFDDDGFPSRLNLNKHGGDILMGSGSYIQFQPYQVGDMLKLVGNGATSRPYISFWSQNASGSLNRAGYIGYPTAASDNPTFTVQSDDGPLHLGSGGTHPIRMYAKSDFEIFSNGVLISDIYTGRILSYSGSNWTSIGADGTWGRLETNLTKFYINKRIMVDSGEVSSYDEDLRLMRAGTLKAIVGAADFGVQNSRFNASINVGTGSDNWNQQQIRAQTYDTSGNDSTNSIAGISLWSQRHGEAPIIRLYGASAVNEEIGFTNQSNSAHTPVRASAFNVSSTARIKDELVWVEDEVAIQLAKNFMLTRFKPKVGPLRLQVTDRFADIDRRWQEKGHSPLDPQDKHWESREIDLDKEPARKFNHDYFYGGLAEWTAETDPEMALVDLEMKPDGLDIAQIAPAALGAAGALARQVEAQKKEIEELRTQLEAFMASFPQPKGVNNENE